MRRWNCGRGVGICALALGLGILIAAIFPVGCLMFIVAFCLLYAGYAVCDSEGRRRNEDHRLEGAELSARNSAVLILQGGIMPLTRS